MRHRQFEYPVMALMFLLLSPAPAPARDWSDLRPAVTTEKELLSWFGPPTEVVATFPWGEWSARWKKRPLTASYRLRYEVGSSSSRLLVGPGGKAEEVEVTVHDGRVGSIWWRYGGPSARSAAASLRETPEFNFRAQNPGSVGARSVEGGWITVDIGENDSVVEVRLQLK